MPKAQTAQKTLSYCGRRHPLAHCTLARSCTNSFSLFILPHGKRNSWIRTSWQFLFQVTPVLLEGLTLTEREHFWGGLVEWPSSCPCSLRNPVTWSKKDVTSSWCHSTSFWPREQKVSQNIISVQDHSLAGKHTHSLLSVFMELQVPTGFHLRIIKIPLSTPSKRFQPRTDANTDPVYFHSFLLYVGTRAQNGELCFQRKKRQNTKKKH